jgi:hypothetical protein
VIRCVSRFRGIAFLGLAAWLVGCTSMPKPPTDQRAGWPGLPPDCWTQSRTYQTDDDEYGWASSTKLEHIATVKPAAVTLSPNHAYYFALSKDQPGQPLVVFAEKDHSIRISFTDAMAVNDVRWINEKLLYMRVWWGRIAATDLVFDVEQERMILSESTHDGAIAMEQYREGCALHGGCKCVAAALAPPIDRSKPPLLAASTAGFSVRHLATVPTIDGKLWLAVQPVREPRSIAAPGGQFVVSLSEPTGEGDVLRYRLTYTEQGGSPVSLASDVVSYVLVAGNSRWIFFEPLEVIDVARWHRYSLSSQLGTSPYVSPQAISADGRRLIVQRRGCAVDCQNLPTEYYEVELPANP